MGLERIVPTLDHLDVMVRLLPRSATGQKITTYLNLITGPRRAGEIDGPEELHVIVLDNGRSRQLGDREVGDVLNCIRCGACLNVCPVYRQIGGHAYGSVYPGPIGAVLTPLLQPESKRAAELAGASSLCGACLETCPVKIPLHDMLVIQRQRNVAARRGTWLERAGFRMFASILRSPRLYSWASRIARFRRERFDSAARLARARSAADRRLDAAPRPALSAEAIVSRAVGRFRARKARAVKASDLFALIAQRLGRSIERRAASRRDRCARIPSRESAGRGAHRSHGARRAFSPRARGRGRRGRDRALGP